MTRHDPPTTAEIVDAIHASTPCTCTPAIALRRHRGAIVRIAATHQPGCAMREGGHQRIKLGNDDDQ